MRKYFANSKTVVSILFLGFFTLTILNSCDKTKKFDGSTWTGDYSSTLDGDKVSSTITLSFNGDQVTISGKIKYSGYGGDTEPVKATGNYTYEKKKMSINVTWKSDSEWMEYYDEGRWTGSVDKTTMTLNNVIGETVKFTKQ
jgi:hypothetical protein